MSRGCQLDSTDNSLLSRVCHHGKATASYIVIHAIHHSVVYGSENRKRQAWSTHRAVQNPCNFVFDFVFPTRGSGFRGSRERGGFADSLVARKRQINGLHLHLCRVAFTCNNAEEELHVPARILKLWVDFFQARAGPITPSLCYKVEIAKRYRMVEQYIDYVGTWFSWIVIYTCDNRG